MRRYSICAMKRRCAPPCGRPRWSGLNCSKLVGAFGFPQRPWEELLEETMAEVDGGA